jgi:hypothetical protein
MVRGVQDVAPARQAWRGSIFRHGDRTQPWQKKINCKKQETHKKNSATQKKIEQYL